MTVGTAGKRYFDYKDVKTLEKYLWPTGKIKPRRVTGLNNVEHAQLVQAIKRARHIALLSCPGKV